MVSTAVMGAGWAPWPPGKALVSVMGTSYVPGARPAAAATVSLTCPVPPAGTSMATGPERTVRPGGGAALAVTATTEPVTLREFRAKVAFWPGGTVTWLTGRYGITGASPVPSEGGSAPGPAPQDAPGVVPRPKDRCPPCRY